MGKPEKTGTEKAKFEAFVDRSRDGSGTSATHRNDRPSR